MKVYLTILFLSVSLIISGTVLGAADEERKIDFLGFSKDSALSMVKIVDPNSGNKIAVFKIPQGKQVDSRTFYAGSSIKKIKDALSKKHHISDSGKMSMQAPDGKITFFGIIRGKNFAIMAMRGNRTAIFTKVPIGKATKVTLKEIWWASDGRSMAVIINKKKSSADYGFDLDSVHFYRYYPSALRFK